ncbi:hypothetical protein LINPERHAP1_LOCUS43190 [Linum perenne]
MHENHVRRHACMHASIKQVAQLLHEGVLQGCRRVIIDTIFPNVWPIQILHNLPNRVVALEPCPKANHQNNVIRAGSISYSFSQRPFPTVSITALPPGWMQK